MVATRKRPAPDAAADASPNADDGGSGGNDRPAKRRADETTQDSVTQEEEPASTASTSPSSSSPAPALPRTSLLTQDRPSPPPSPDLPPRLPSALALGAASAHVFESDASASSGNEEQLPIRRILALEGQQPAAAAAAAGGGTSNELLNSIPSADPELGHMVRCELERLRSQQAGQDVEDYEEVAPAQTSSSGHITTTASASASASASTSTSSASARPSDTEAPSSMCAICLDSFRPSCLVILPCCGRDSDREKTSTTRFCPTCIIKLSHRSNFVTYGSWGLRRQNFEAFMQNYFRTFCRIGDCPRCHALIAVTDRKIPTAGYDYPPRVPEGLMRRVTGDVGLQRATLKQGIRFALEYGRDPNEDPRLEFFRNNTLEWRPPTRPHRQGAGGLVGHNSAMMSCLTFLAYTPSPSWIPVDLASDFGKTLFEKLCRWNILEETKADQSYSITPSTQRMLRGQLPVLGSSQRDRREVVQSFMELQEVPLVPQLLGLDPLPEEDEDHSDSDSDSDNDDGGANRSAAKRKLIRQMDGMVNLVSLGLHLFVTALLCLLQGKVIRGIRLGHHAMLALEQSIGVIPGRDLDDADHNEAPDEPSPNLPNQRRPWQNAFVAIMNAMLSYWTLKLLWGLLRTLLRRGSAIFVILYFGGTILHKRMPSSTMLDALLGFLYATKEGYFSQRLSFAFFFLAVRSVFISIGSPYSMYIVLFAERLAGAHVIPMLVQGARAMVIGQ